MGWQDRSIISGRLDRGNFVGSGHRHLVGWEKEPHPFTVSVTLPTVGAGAVGHADVAIPGSGLTVSRWHKCLTLAPPTLEAGLVLLMVTIIDAESVRVL